MARSRFCPPQDRHHAVAWTVGMLIFFPIFWTS